MDVSSGLVVALLAAEVVGDCAKGPSKVVYSLTEPRQRRGENEREASLGYKVLCVYPSRGMTNKEIRGWEGGRKAVGVKRKAKETRGIFLVDRHNIYHPYTAYTNCRRQTRVTGVRIRSDSRAN